MLDSTTNQPVQLATVSILDLKDSSLVAYTVTDKTGQFALRNLREVPSRLLISHVGYKGMHINIDFKKDKPVDLGNIYLLPKLLQEVMVKGERIPVLVKKDTIEFDAEAFKTRPNALVEDLLKKLPGVQVDRSGHITVEGIDVSKIKVNGKTFFANDPTTATRNLDADMISKVQVYDDRDDDPDHLVPEYQVKKILNLKFKKKFAKDILATLGGGAGTQDRYAAAGFMAKFQDDLQLSAKVGSDNLSNTGNFTGNYGGFSTFMYGAPGRQTINSGNVDYTEDITKKLKLHIEYRVSNHVSDNIRNSRTQQNVVDTIFTTLTTAVQHQNHNEQNFHAETEYKPDSLTIIKYVPDIDYEAQRSTSYGNSIKNNTYFPLLNADTNTDRSSSNSFQYQQNISYYRKLNNQGVSLTFSNSINLHPQTSLDKNTDNLISYVAALPSDTLARSSDNKANENSEGLTASLHYPFNKKLWVDLSLTGLRDENSGDLLTFEEDFKTGLYDIYVPDQSSDLVRSLWGEGLNPQLTYNFTDNFFIKAGVTALAQQIDNHFGGAAADLDQNFFYWLPSAGLHYHDWDLSYAKTVQQPSINSLQPITIIYSPLYTFIGNPNLKPTYYNNVNLGYHNYMREKQMNLYLNFRVILEQNTIVNEQSINAEGANVTTPVNRNGRFTTYLSGGFFRSFKKHGKWQLHTDANLNVAVGHNFFIVNNQSGYQNTQNIIFTPHMAIDWDNLLTFEPSYNVNFATTEYKLVNYPSNNYTTQGAGMAVDLSEPKNFRWRISYNYVYNPLVAPGFQRNTNLLNFSVTRRIQKNGHGELGLTCYDLLNQNVSNSHYVVANTINDVQNQVLRRYVLLTYTYHFNKFK